MRIHFRWTLASILEGVGWLRAFDVSLSLGDKERAKQIVASLFSFYDTVAKPRLIGV